MSDSSRFEKPPHPYLLVNFTELGSRIIGPDGRCTCTRADYCPLGRKGMESRCAVDELEKLNQEAIRRRAWQSADY